MSTFKSIRKTETITLAYDPKTTAEVEALRLAATMYPETDGWDYAVNLRGWVEVYKTLTLFVQEVEEPKPETKTKEL